MNRTQRRQTTIRSRNRGIGFTRQYSSARARLRYGTQQKFAKPSFDIAELQRLLKQYENEPETSSSAPIEASFKDEFVYAPEETAQALDILLSSRLEDAVTEEYHDHTDVVHDHDTFDLLGGDTFTPTDTPANLSSQESEELNRYLDWSAKDLTAEIVSGNFDPILAELRTRELDGKGRITVLKAIDQRLKQVNTSGVIPPEGVVLGQTTAAEMAEILKNR